jgi:hypothetical protein
MQIKSSKRGSNEIPVKPIKSFSQVKLEEKSTMLSRFERK